ncbi:tetratricopeptide repeat protein [Streptomyces sp. TLI_171]|uniref:tetratricopeptide repeat protein n=1 Tax=Streptomyces sp. TLI_171 TaxID=1938859 RepID=UPI000C1A3FBB|nr:tetratricopeptide repeat protein [Streptomyces sp. TLI_171]RKE18390.1 tetratricopeptide repeat protein [Streptomyces sp. TLI_171]
MASDVHHSYRRLFGDTHLPTVVCASNPGSYQRRSGAPAGALQYGRSAVAGLTRPLGADHPDTLAAQADLAIVLRALGRGAEAVTLRLRARAALTGQYGEGHPPVDAVGSWRRTDLDLASQPL